MIVRIANLDDLHKLSVFFSEAWKQAGQGALGFTGATEESIHRIESEEFLGPILINRETRIFIAEDSGRIVGFSSLKPIDHGAVELSGLVVLEESTGKGIGSELFEKAKEFAVQSGYRRVIVKTEIFNERAISFYKELGFSEISTGVEAVGESQVGIVILESSLG